jgi:thiol-disulfide isomerase/thioredoxin
MRRILQTIPFLLTFLISIPCFAQENDDLKAPYFNSDNQIIWGTTDGKGNAEIALYFFWSKSCPHCTLARPVIAQIERETPWLRLHSLPIDEKENRRLGTMH